MKTILSAIFIIGIILFPTEEKREYPPVTFCHPADAFAEFADQDEFLSAHYLPENTPSFQERGEQIQFDVADGVKANAYILQPDEPSEKWLFVIHEWWGLNDHIKQEAEKYFDALGYNVLAIDMYDGKVAIDRKTAAQYVQACSKERAEAIINGAYSYAGEDAQVGSVGWCFGGGWSLQTGILGDEQAKASIIYYGMPEKDPSKLKNLKADVLGIFAANEKWISPEIVAEFEKNMRLLNKNLTVKSYDADHAFANPSRPAYVKEFADEAFELSIAFLKERI